MTQTPFLSLVDGNCFDVLPAIPNASVDLIVADLPYQKSACRWDKVLDPEALWIEFRRVLTDTGTVVAFGCEPFTLEFAYPARDLLKYDLIWSKTKPTSHLHVNNRPLCGHENIYVFSKGAAIHEGQTKRRMTYNPDGEKVASTVRFTTSEMYRQVDRGQRGRPYLATVGASSSVLHFAKDPRVDGDHPSRKPLALLEWIVARYSHPGDLVLDPTMGSGTTGSAAVGQGRDFIGVEKEPSFYATACQRIGEAMPGELAA